MSKDGSHRGGRRVRAGTKPQGLSDKLMTGRQVRVLDVPDLTDGVYLDAPELGSPTDLTGADMPAPSEYLSARQKDGRPLGADALFRQTWLWLKERRCEQFVKAGTTPSDIVLPP